LICRAEEKQMSELQGQAYLDYQKQTGMFFPKPTAVSILFGLIVLATMAGGIYFKYTEIETLPKPESETKLHLGIMIHLEGWNNEVTNQGAFEEHATATRLMATTLEKYGAKGTFEARPEFVQASKNWNDNVLAELVERGHGVGLHADVGGNVERDGLDQKGMVSEISKMKIEFEKLSGIEARHVSGVCSSLDWVAASIAAGFKFTTGGVSFCAMSLSEENQPEEYSNCPIPSKCHDVFPSEMSDRIHPWRTSSGANWLEYDPEGELVILASDDVLYGYDGNYDDMSQSDAEAGISALKEALANVQEGQVNLMYVAWSIGSEDKVASPALEEWLQAVEPYVKAGLVEWTTLPEIYDLYLDWESSEAEPQAEPVDQPVAELTENDQVEVIRDIEYAEVDGTSLKLDLYRPVDTDEDLPLIIWTHGGAFSSGDKSDVSSMCQRLATDGFSVASLNFRLSGQAIWPAQIHDSKAAVRWLRANADNYNIDPDRIGVIGSSSGGHLAAVLGTTAGVEEIDGTVGNYDNVSTQVQAVVDMFGPVDFVSLSSDCAGVCVLDHDDSESPESRYLGCALPDCLEKAGLASATPYIDSSDPPFLIIHGDQDTTIPMAQSVNFASELNQAGVEAEFIEATGFAHNYNMFWNYSAQIIKFFTQELK
ncbi:MAG: alpha/beta hydrolase fold domain-containing protein, partial [Candidatus Uhrbacteria bacterium]